MKTLRLMLVVAALVAIVWVESSGPAPANAQQQNEPEANICFLWAFGGLVMGKHETELVSITRDTALKSGDRIKFFVKLEKRCFIYLIYHSSQGELIVLFPYRFDQLGPDAPTAAGYYVPQDDDWFELDERVGPETFYLLASEKRLDGLEEIINKYETADPAKKPELVKKLLAEIRNLRWKHRQFKSFVERPVTTIGKLRGTEKTERHRSADVAGLAVEISGQNFYSRTFTIDHR